MLARTLQDEGFDAIRASTFSEGINSVNKEKVDLVLTDLKLPRKEKGGIEILQHVKQVTPFCPVIIMTAYGTIETAVQAVKEGAFEFLTKPFDIDHLIVLIRRALENQQLVTENMILRDEVAQRVGFPEIIGKSDVMVELSKTVKKVAKSDSTVLLLGESGTGKELFARAIHQISDRKDNPFVAINCAAIPKELLENELFGYEKGAYTGAVNQKVGKFELADKGTIFLDEIGDLDLSLQAKILRVIQEREFERVGGTQKIKVDVRIIAASNKDLTKLAEERDFREDLYYRISVFPINIPPLRDRLSDVPYLVEHFVKRYTQEMRKNIESVSDAAMEKMQSYSWPGNVRELQNTVERAVILCEGTRIHEEHILINPVKRAPKKKVYDLEECTLKDVGSEAAKIAEIDLIKQVLKKTRGNKSKAAKILDVSYKTLLTRIKEYEIED
jgi:DNA-binding NtrC family response regulator